MGLIFFLIAVVAVASVVTLGTRKLEKAKEQGRFGATVAHKASRMVRAYWVSVMFAGALMARSGRGRVVLAALCGFLLLDAVLFTYDAEIAPPFGWTLFGLAAFAYGYFELRQRSKWERRVEEVVRARLGYRASEDIVLAFGDGGNWLGRLGRYTGSREWRAGVPARLDEDKLLAVEEDLRRRIPTDFSGVGARARLAAHQYLPREVAEALGDEAWAFDWDLVHGFVSARLVPDLPRMAAHPAVHGKLGAPGRATGDPAAIRLGLLLGGDEVVWEARGLMANLLLGGSPGGGKSAIINSILNHALHHRASWRVRLIDAKQIEFQDLKRYPRSVERLALTLEDAVRVLEETRAEMFARKPLFEGHRAKKLEDLNGKLVAAGEEPLSRILLVVDEVAELVGLLGGKDQEAKETDAMRARCKSLIDSVVQLGRAYGVVCVLSTQRPDAEFVSGRTKSNIGCRTAMGYMSPTGSRMVLDESDAASKLPSIAGRGIILMGGREQVFQSYYTPDDALIKTLDTVEAMA